MRNYFTKIINITPTSSILFLYDEEVVIYTYYNYNFILQWQEFFLKQPKLVISC
jgi:hypothetical protein